MHKTAAALVTLAVATGVVTACNTAGSASSTTSASASYCKDIRADKARFQALDNGDVAQLDTALVELHHLAGEAPAPVGEAWRTLDGAITSMRDALKEAGVSFADLAKMQAGEVPPNVDVNKLTA